MRTHAGAELLCRLTFRSIRNRGRALSFPCDSHGDAHLDGLTDRARANYFFARATVRREFLWPVVEDGRRLG